ncbi:MarR family winged helix-turn-helix transcriptional regulator [Hoeflea alexandrii]|uniref:MarR family winged helix-turn-helix transcriptional regulator n=1 Tax=Hoeflea alexandrii TaxID=288436 RepID=UPI0022B02A8E|nr:MarR family transcriptional regulator [Hoeflea alexandrii]MCZ4292150.1 MarR family transcriptional regulator [Hoeflea alexandrii]
MKNPIESYISYTLAAAHRAVHQSLTAALKEHGVQVEVWRVLETLDAEPSQTMGELARIVLMNPPTLTKMVDRMVMDGLVHRQAGKSDQRQVNLMLTDLGRKRMAQIRDVVQSQDEAIYNLLGESEVAKLNDILGRLM